MAERGFGVLCIYYMSEPEFVPKPGQVDYTDIRYAPVINCVVQYEERILVVERSSAMRLYPGYWNGISGFLDDNRGIEDHVQKELREEVGILPENIIEIRRGAIFEIDAPEYKKTWIVHPILVKVKTDEIKLDWEARRHRWTSLEEVKHLKLVPGFDSVLERMFSA